MNRSNRLRYAVTPVISFLLSVVVIVGSVGTAIYFSYNYLDEEKSKVALGEVGSQLEYLSTTFDDLSKSTFGDSSEVPLSIHNGDMSMDRSYANSFEKPISDLGSYDSDSVDNNRNIFYYSTKKGYNFTVDGLDDSNNKFSISDLEGVDINDVNATAYWLKENDPPEIEDCLGDFSVGTGDSKVIWINATDDTGIDSVKIYIGSDIYDMVYNEDNDHWEYRYISSSDNVSDYNYYVKVFDVADVSITSPSYEINVFDNDPPTITDFSRDVLVSKDSSVCLWAQATDNIGVNRALISVDGGSSNSLSYNISRSRWEYTFVSGSEETILSYSITVFDAAGNSDISGGEITVGDSGTIYSGNLSIDFSDYENMTVRDSTLPDTTLWVRPDNDLSVSYATVEFKCGDERELNMEYTDNVGNLLNSISSNSGWEFFYESPPHTPPVAYTDFAEIEISDGNGQVSIDVLDNDYDYDPYNTISSSTVDLSDVVITKNPEFGIVEPVRSRKGIVLNYTASNWVSPFGSNINCDFFNYTVRDGTGILSNEATVYIYRLGHFNDLSAVLPFTINRRPDGTILSPVTANNDFFFINNTLIDGSFQLTKDINTKIKENDIPSNPPGEIEFVYPVFFGRYLDVTSISSSDGPVLGDYLFSFTDDFGPDILTYVAIDDQDFVSLPAGIVLAGDEQYKITLYDEYDNTLDSSPWYDIHYNRPPVADAGGPYSGVATENITFDGSGSYDPDYGLSNYTWSFGDGETENGVSPTHVYSSPGTYDVILTVKDSDGCINRDYTTVEVDPKSGGGGGSGGQDSWISGPTDVFMCGPYICEDYSITIPDNEDLISPFTYQWESMIDGDTYGWGTEDSANICFDYYNGEGIRTIICTITDCLGNTREKTLIVRVHLDFSATIYADYNPLYYGWERSGNDFTSCNTAIGGGVRIRANAYCGTPPYQYQWNLPNFDGSEFTWTGDPYIGSKTFTVTITDSEGETATASKVIENIKTDISLDFGVGGPDTIEYLQSYGRTKKECYWLNELQIIEYTDCGGGTQCWSPYDDDTTLSWSSPDNWWWKDPNLGCDSHKYDKGTCKFGWEAPPSDQVRAVLDITTSITKNGNSVTLSGSRSKSTIVVNENCFLNNTKILGKNSCYYNIEDIAIGDNIKSYDFKTNKIVNSTVKHVYSYKKTDINYDYYILINNQLKVTPNHEFYTNDRWVNAEMLKIGDRLFDKNSEFLTIDSIEKIYEKETVFDLDVEPYDNYFVNINGRDVLVHNQEYSEPAPGDTFYLEDLTKTGNEFNSTENWPFTGAVCIYLKDSNGVFGKIWVFDYDRPEFSLSDKSKKVTMINNLVCYIAYNDRYVKEVSESLEEIDNSLSIDYIQTKTTSSSMSFSGSTDFKMKSSILYKNSREVDRNVYNFYWEIYDDQDLSDLVKEHYKNTYNFQDSSSDGLYYIGSDQGLKLSFVHNVMSSYFKY